jgi:WD domain, G-beta repeat
VSGVAFAPDGQTLASSSWDRTVRFWDTATGEPSLKFPTLQEPDGALSLAYSPDGTKLAIGHAAGWVPLRDLAATRELLRANVHSEDVQSVAFAPDGRTFATSGYQDPFVCIRDSETGRERHKLAFQGTEAPGAGPGSRSRSLHVGPVFRRQDSRLVARRPNARLGSGFREDQAKDRHQGRCEELWQECGNRDLAR